MSKKELELSLSALKALLHYNPETGQFHWIVNRGPVSIGLLAGSPNKGGYLQIQIDGRKYQAQRLAFLFVNGLWPTGVVDHIDGNKLNNQIENLRDVTRKTNQQNQRRAQGKQGERLLGVSAHYGKFQARIRIGARQVRLGTFATAEAAHQAYLDAKRAHHEGNTL